MDERDWWMLLQERIDLAEDTNDKKHIALTIGEAEELIKLLERYDDFTSRSPHYADLMQEKMPCNGCTFLCMTLPLGGETMRCLIDNKDLTKDEYENGRKDCPVRNI